MRSTPRSLRSLLPARGGWSSWRTIPANITKVTGTHNVYLEFSSGAPGDPPYVSLHYFNFPVS